MAGSQLDHGAVSVGTSAVKVIAGKSQGDDFQVRNNHATAIIYLGGSGVTTANGFPVKAGESETFEGFVGDLYAISDTAATDVRWLRVI